MNKNMIIDIETLGVDMNAPILSVGAVITDLDDPDGTLDSHLYEVVALSAMVKIELDTLTWWLRDPGNADHLNELLNSAHTSYMEDILGQLRSAAENCVAVWGYGAAFDNAIINQVSRKLTGEPCWSYKKDRCLRTLVATLPWFTPPERPEAPRHHALHDAMYQAKVLREAMSHANALRLPTM